MALPGNTWNSLLQQVGVDFQRLDLVTSPTAVSTDPAWVWGTSVIQRVQPQIWIPGQAYNQWLTTFANQNLYALPVDFEDDMQILQLQFGRLLPLIKISEQEMNQKDVQIPPVIGQAINYCIFGNAAQYYSAQNPGTWQTAFNYTSIFNGKTPPYPPYLILDGAGNIQALTSIAGNGTSGGTTPAFSTTPGVQVLDGTTTGSPPTLVNGVTWTCWFNMSNSLGPLLRLWPWPDQAYPMTAVYQNKIPVPATAGTSNFWTVDAELFVRMRTEMLLRKNYMREDGWELDEQTAMDEFKWLQGRVRQLTAVGHARPCYL